jgi:hypothetical protein
MLCLRQWLALACSQAREEQETLSDLELENNIPEQAMFKGGTPPGRQPEGCVVSAVWVT